MSLKFCCRILPVCCLMWLTLNLVAEAQTPQTIIPKDNPVGREHGWTKECEDRVAAAQNHTVDLLFIGDSITQNFVEKPTPGWGSVGRNVWDKNYANKNALNFGVGSDGTEHILWRMDHMDIMNFKPKVVVILAGINDAQYSAGDIAAGVKAVIEKTKTMYPAAKIVSMNILPSTRAKAKMDAANQIIQTFADNKTVFSLDLSPQMPPAGGNWKGVGGDHLHLTPQGYEIWASNLNPLLEKLMF